MSKDGTRIGSLAREVALRDRIRELEAERDALLAEIDLLRDPVSPSNLRDLGEYLARLLDEDQWPRAERTLNAALSERHTLLAELAQARAERDALRADIEWIERWFFERKWSGTLGEPSYWEMAGPYRHTLKVMRGENLRAAIDAARAQGEEP